DKTMAIILLVVELTDKGLDKLEIILEEIYNYINLIKSKGINKMYYNEAKKMNEINFNYQEKTDSANYATYLSQNMTTYPIKYLLYGPHYYKKYNESTSDILRNYLNYLVKNNSVVIISSKNHENYTD